MDNIRNWIRKYFIPHNGNDYKPHFLRHDSFTIVFLIIIIIELAFLAQVFLVFDKTKFLAAVLPGVLTSLTNDERAQNDAPPLTTNALLAQAAQMKANDMAANGYFAHTSPAGLTPWYWFAQVGYKYSRAGENLAVNFFDSADVAQAWMNSPTHRENIVKKEYTEIGIGVANGVYQGHDTVFVAQLFGTPISFSTETQVEPQARAVAPSPQSTPTPVKITSSKTPRAPLIARIPVLSTIIPTTSAPTSIEVLGEQSSTNPNVIVGTGTIFSKAYSGLKSFVQRALTSPRESAAYVFGGIALLVLLALLFAYFMRFELNHPWSFLRGLSLFAVVIVLLFVNIRVLNIQKTEVPAGISADLNANSIEALQ